MLDKNKLPSKPITPDGTTKKTSSAGPLPQGGKTGYHELTLGKGFTAHNAIPGHTQKKNVDK